MTDSQRINELMHYPPQVQLTRREQALRIFGYVCSVIAIISLFIGVYAVRQVVNATACINNILGERAPTSAKDNAAHVAFAKAVQGLIHVSPAASRADRVAEVVKFQTEVNRYVTVLVADQADRDAHPLGRC